MQITLDELELFYYVEGLAKYGKADWQWCIDILPKISDDMRQFLRARCLRNLGYLYGLDERINRNRRSEEEKAAFEAFLRVYDIPITDTDAVMLSVDVDLDRFKCYIASMGHGSHHRQHIWEYLINRYDKVPEDWRVDLREWAEKEFDIESMTYHGAGKDFKQFLDRYDTNNVHNVSIRYSLNGEKGEKTVTAYLHNGDYYINYSQVVCDWKRNKDFVEITKIDGKGIDKGRSSR